jgi:hypothetical protein
MASCSCHPPCNTQPLLVRHAGQHFALDDRRWRRRSYEDLQSGRQQIETRVREALECEKAFTETTKVLVEHLRDKPECRELLEDIAKGSAG